tara:strand:+ start:2899 stop:3330 length:432 start_codon:yes stop_codon:yes gene_type:complete
LVENKKTDGQHCGTKPKKIAFGIAPLGIISIGIVPMGVISIGIVPMGVFSFGAVAMGIVNLSIVGMGIISSGITTMGVWEYSPRSNHHNHRDLNSSSRNPVNKFSLNKKMLFESKMEAEKMAKKLNCTGSHKMGDYWMPCDSH